MKEYTYEVELIEELPAEIPLKKCGTITTKREWYGHSYGDAVGRIYADGTVKSFFTADIENGETRLFDLLRNSRKVKSKHRFLVNRETGKEFSCDEYYVMRKVKGHSSEKPTVMNESVDICMNVKYEYTYEVLLVADDDYKRYVTKTIKTDGPHTYCLANEIQSLESVFEEWLMEEENGFREDEDGTIYARFYDDFGKEIEAEFYNINELMRCVNSVRIVDLKTEIIK